MMKIGTLVQWTKKLNNYPGSEEQTIPAIVNQVWEDGKNVSLFVFSFDGGMSQRSVPMSELREIADPDALALLLITAPAIMRQQADDLTLYGAKIEEAFRRIGELEESITSANKMEKKEGKKT